MYKNAFVSCVRIGTNVYLEERKYSLTLDGQLTWLRHTVPNTASAACGLELNVHKKKMSAYQRERERERSVYSTQINLRLDLLALDIHI